MSSAVRLSCTALSALWRIVDGAVAADGETPSIAMEEAGAIPALVHIASTSQDTNKLLIAAGILSVLAHESPRRSAAIIGARGVAALARRMSRGGAHLESLASKALVSIGSSSAGNSRAASAAAVEAGAIPAAVRHLRSSDAGTVEQAATLLERFGLDSLSRWQAIVEAGGLPALVRCLRRCSTPSGTAQAQAQEQLLGILWQLTADHSRAVAAADGAMACVEALACPLKDGCKGLAATVLCCLVLHGHTQAVVAADPLGTVNAALEACLQQEQATEFTRLGLETALGDLAAAREELMQPASAAAASPTAPGAPALAPAPPSAPASPASPHVCTAPGCGATGGRLRRCGACGTVRYWCEACRDAHWSVHRPECKRIRAERAAAEASAASSGAAGPSQR